MPSGIKKLNLALTFLEQFWLFFMFIMIEVMAGASQVETVA